MLYKNAREQALISLLRYLNVGTHVYCRGAHTIYLVVCFLLQLHYSLKYVLEKKSDLHFQIVLFKIYHLEQQDIFLKSVQQKSKSISYTLKI